LSPFLNAYKKNKLLITSFFCALYHTLDNLMCRCRRQQLYVFVVERYIKSHITRENGGETEETLITYKNFYVNLRTFFLLFLFNFWTLFVVTFGYFPVYIISLRYYVIFKAIKFTKFHEISINLLKYLRIKIFFSRFLMKF